MYCIVTIVRLLLSIFPFFSPIDGHFSHNMLFIVTVCIVCEKPDYVWKRTTLGYSTVVAALSIHVLAWSQAILS